METKGQKETTITILTAARVFFIPYHPFWGREIIELFEINNKEGHCNGCWGKRHTFIDMCRVWRDYNSNRSKMRS
jgi:hypothetical protein